MKRFFVVAVCLSVLIGMTPASTAATESKPSLKLQCPGYRIVFNYQKCFEPLLVIEAQRALGH